MIAQLQNDNGELSQLVNKKDDENRQLAELVQEMERRVKKAQGASKDKNRLRREAKDREIQLQKLRKELIEVNKQNNGLNAALKEAKTSQGNAPIRPISSVPRVA